MLGRMSHLSSLQSRKQLLIAESELNRAQLSEEWQSMAHGVGDLAHQVKTIGAWLSLGVSLVAGVTALRRRPSAPHPAKSAWFQKILDGARVVSTIWFAFRARGHEAEQMSPRSPPRSFARSAQ